jgi:hypothetical protein
VTESIRELLKKKPDDKPEITEQVSDEAIDQVAKKVVNKVPAQKAATNHPHHSTVRRMQKEALYKAKRIIKK